MGKILQRDFRHFSADPKGLSFRAGCGSKNGFRFAWKVAPMDRSLAAREGAPEPAAGPFYSSAGAFDELF